MILPLTIFLLTVYYSLAYGLIRYAVINTLKRRVASTLCREALLLAYVISTPLVIANSLTAKFRK